MKYYIGIDGGGTHTEIEVIDKNKETIKMITAPSASWREYGVKTVVENIFNAINDIIDINDIIGIVAGMPCFGESVEGDLYLKKEFNNFFLNIPLRITNDVEVGWAGSLGLMPGINIVSGTGAIAFGKDSKGNSARCGGWDDYFGDEGSCYWIGRKFMEVFSKQADGRLKKDKLYNMVYEKFELKNDFDFIDYVREHFYNSRKKIANLQLLVKEAAEKGDQSARQIYIDAVDELILLLKGIKSNLKFENEEINISYSGGLFKTKDFVMPYFEKRVNDEDGVLVKPLYSPAKGAALLAANEF